MVGTCTVVTRYRTPSERLFIVLDDVRWSFWQKRKSSFSRDWYLYDLLPRWILLASYWLIWCPCRDDKKPWMSPHLNTCTVLLKSRFAPPKMVQSCTPFTPSPSNFCWNPVETRRFGIKGFDSEVVQICTLAWQGVGSPDCLLLIKKW